MTDLSAFRAHWTERRPAPPELTGDEITSFLDEHEVQVCWTPASVHFPRIVTLKSDSFPTTQGYTLREAVCLAAAKWKASNE